MSTPPTDRPPPQSPPPGEPPERVEVERKSASPLVWLLLLIALLAIGWYFYSQRGPVEAPAEPAVPIGEAEIGDGSPPPPASETPATQQPAAPEPSAPADQPAEPLAQIQPEYPAAALRSREEGTVLLRVEVDAQGNPASVEIERSSRSRDLDRAAREAVGQWTFSPAIENGQPVASTVTVPVDFRVDEQ